MSYFNNKNGFFTQKVDNKQEVVSITYEEIGLFPRSFSRVLDRFLKQVFSDVENLVIQEYRFYRYLFLTTLKCLLILFFVPFFVNFLAKTYIVRPLTEYFWNTKQSEIFLNSYQQKRAFSELKEFEEKTYFESLIFPKSAYTPPKASSSLRETPNFTVFLPSPNPNLNLSNSDISSNSTSNSSSFNSLGKSKSTGQIDSQNNQQTEISNLSSATTKQDIYTSSLTEPQKLSTTTPISSQLNKEVTFFEDKQIEELEQDVTQKKLMFVKNEENEENQDKVYKGELSSQELEDFKQNKEVLQKDKIDDYKQTELLINSYTMKSSLFVYQTQEAGKNMQQRYQEKTIELAQRYNDQSIEAITNFFADLISLFTLFYLLYALEIQINITKSFLLEVFFGLDDSKKSLLILLITDLLVGYHSSNLWELFFEFLFHHYGLPESQTGIFLLVATLPVLLDVLFKYLIFRHLNRSSPATVATYRAMIE